MRRMETNEQNNINILTPVSHVNTFYFYSCSSTEKRSLLEDLRGNSHETFLVEIEHTEIPLIFNFL